MNKRKLQIIGLLLFGFLIGYFNQQLSIYFLNYNTLIGLLSAFVVFLVIRLCDSEMDKVKLQARISGLEDEIFNVVSAKDKQHPEAFATLDKKLTDLGNKMQLERNREMLSDSKIEQLIRSEFMNLKAGITKKGGKS